MSAHEVMVWSVTPGLLSEGPHWHEEHQELLWVDILGRQMHRGTLTPMTPWNALRQSRSTGTSARSRRPPGAGTCSPQARDSCSLFLTCRALLRRGGEVNHPASAIAVIRLPHGGPVTSDLACDVAPPVTAGHCRSCRPGQLRLSRFTAAMQSGEFEVRGRVALDRCPLLLEGLVGNCCRKEDIAATPLSVMPLIPTAGSRRRSPLQGPVIGVPSGATITVAVGVGQDASAVGPGEREGRDCRDCPEYCLLTSTAAR
jgi:hypothetical protein